MQRIELLRHYKNKRALVLDDFPNIRSMVKKMLETVGVEKVDTAATAEDAMALCERNAYDIVMTDHNLGERKNGQQLLEEIRYKGLFRYSSIYIMITAETTRDKVYNAIENQPDTYLSKPFTAPELQKRLDAIMVARIDLAQINAAADEGDVKRVIALCRERVAKKDRYMVFCQKMLGLFLCQDKQFDAAEQLYKQVLEARDLTWAQIGLGRVYLATEQLSQAKSLLGGLVTNRTHFLEVYDALATVYQREGDFFQAQKVLEQANYLAPDAVLRQLSMARYAEINGDFERAEKAYRYVIKAGYHSIYERPENYLAFMRCLNTSSKCKEAGDKARFKESREILARLMRRYRDNTAVVVQAGFVDAQSHCAQGDIEEGKRLLAKNETPYCALAQNNEAPLELILDYAKALEATGDRDKAVLCLESALQRYGNRLADRVAIDGCLAEPISDKGKEDLKAFNRDGKVLFEKKQFQQAVTFFGIALFKYPHNLALSINMAMALIRLFEQTPPEAHQLNRLKAVLMKLNEIHKGHNYYAIYVTIQEQADAFFANH